MELLADIGRGVIFLAFVALIVLIIYGTDKAGRS